MIKPGGEWISSVALENALMGHPVQQIPRTSTGKFLETKLREEYGDYLLKHPRE